MQKNIAKVYKIAKYSVINITKKVILFFWCVGVSTTENSKRLYSYVRNGLLCIFRGMALLSWYIGTVIAKNSEKIYYRIPKPKFNYIKKEINIL